MTNPKKNKSQRRKRPKVITQGNQGANRKTRRADIAFERTSVSRTRKVNMARMKMEQSQARREKIIRQNNKRK